MNANTVRTPRHWGYNLMAIILAVVMLFAAFAPALAQDPTPTPEAPVVIDEPPAEEAAPPADPMVDSLIEAIMKAVMEALAPLFARVEALEAKPAAPAVAPVVGPYPAPVVDTFIDIKTIDVAAAPNVWDKPSATNMDGPIAGVHPVQFQIRHADWDVDASPELYAGIISYSDWTVSEFQIGTTIFTKPHGTDPDTGAWWFMLEPLAEGPYYLHVNTVQGKPWTGTLLVDENHNMQVFEGYKGYKAVQAPPVYEWGELPEMTWRVAEVADSGLITATVSMEDRRVTMHNHGKSPDLAGYVPLLLGPWCDGTDDDGLADCPVAVVDSVREWLTFEVAGWDGSPVRTNVIYVTSDVKGVVSPEWQWYWVGPDGRDFVVFDTGEDLNFAAPADNNPGYQFFYDFEKGAVLPFDTTFEWGPVDYTGQSLGVTQLESLKVLAVAAKDDARVVELDALITAAAAAVSP